MGTCSVRASKAKEQDMVLTPSKWALVLQATKRSMFAALSELGVGKENKMDSVRCAWSWICNLLSSVKFVLMWKQEWCSCVGEWEKEREKRKKTTTIGQHKVKKTVCSDLMLVKFLSCSEWQWIGKLELPEPASPSVVDSPSRCTCRPNERTSVSTDENIPVEILSLLPAYLAHLELGHAVITCHARQ